MEEKKVMSDEFKATKELVLFVVSLIKAIVTSVDDGISIADAANFIKPALLSLDAFKDIDKAKLEIQNLQENQWQELIQIVNSNLDQTDKSDLIIKKSFEIGLKIFELYAYVKKN
jgi:hypothetical protein